MNIAKQVKDILNGYKNYLIPNPVTEEIALQRASVCGTCEFKKKGLHAAVLPDYKIKELNGYYCDACLKCPLSAKVRSVDHQCPENKW